MSASNSDSRNETSHARRASFSPGSTLTELFSGRVPPPPFPGPNANPAQRNRRMSVSAVPSSPISQSSILPLRRGSVSSVGSSISTMDENALEEDNGSPTSSLSPFARRMSWGTRGLRDVRMPGRGTFQPPGVARENARSGGQSPPLPVQPGDNPHHQRRPSVSTMPLPVNIMPAAMPAKQHHDDPLQERILKGDFYMD